MFSKITYVSIFVIVILSVSLQVSKCDYDEHRNVDEKEQAVNAAYEYYKNLYLNFYGDSSQPPKDIGSSPLIGSPLSHISTPSKLSGFFDKQGLGEIIGPETAILLGLVGAIFGSLAAIGVAMNANSLSSLSSDQDNICTTAQSLGGFTCTTSSSTITLAEATTCFSTIAGYATPSC